MRGKKYNIVKLNDGSIVLLTDKELQTIEDVGEQFDGFHDHTVVAPDAGEWIKEKLKLEQ